MKLINDGVLVCQPILLNPHEFHKIWAPDFMESITFLKASKAHYQSCLHFFWQSIFHQREVTNLNQAQEIFSSTHLYKIDFTLATALIKEHANDWYQQHQQLIPNAKWINQIWNDDNDVLIVFEDDEYFYAWGWDCIL